MEQSVKYVFLALSTIKGSYKGPPFILQGGGGGGAGVFVADKLFIWALLGGALKIAILLHVYIEQLLK